MAKQSDVFKDVITGRAFKIGDNINTDLIFPGRYLSLTDPCEIGKHALEGLGKEFPSILEKNSFIVAGINFGCGSSREHAVTCLKYAGVAGVIANGFARIFYRNAINLGFPVIQCPAAVGSIKNRDVIAINFSAGKIMVRKNEFFFPQLPADIMNIFKVGGLVNYAKKLFEQNRKNNI